MQFNMTVIKESQGGYDGRRGRVETFEITGSEQGPNPLLQLCDYQLREEEKQLFGKLAGKSVVLSVVEIRSIFSGRPRFSGNIVSVGGKPVAEFVKG